MAIGEQGLRLHFDDQIVVCGAALEMSRQLGEGYIVADTRLASGYRVKLAGVKPVLLDSVAVSAHAARVEMTNPTIDAASGKVPANVLHLRVDRTVAHGIHDDYDVTNFADEPVDVVLEISVESDFADVFDVKDHKLIRRGSLQTTWDEATCTLSTQYRNETFHRALHLVVDRNDAEPEYGNGALSFRLRLEPGESWHTCVLWIPEIDGERPNRPSRECHDLDGGGIEADRAMREWIDQAARLRTGKPELDGAIEQAVEDLASLRLHTFDAAAIGDDHPGTVDGAAERDGEIDVHAWVPAGGVPWFVTLFGRDSLTVSLQTLGLSAHFARGALHALASFQANEYDPARDMEPGKIIHEIRRGELASLDLIPHTPYYGTADATTLYVLAAARAWKWNGSRAVLESLRPAVERALAWIDRDGDRDGDGFQEYGTRAPTGGYFNQGWKDSGDAIVHADGSLPKLPIALCELQGYVVDAKRAWAAVLEEAWHEDGAAQRLRDDADRLAELIETRLWWDEEQTYFLGLDGDKQPIRTVASNPGHLLWSRAIAPERAAAVAARLLAPDMWSGWGIRTLSSAHVSYNPMAYQLGAVWPHDNGLIVAGMRAYGLDEAAAQVAGGLFDAAARLPSHRLPELFAGFGRDVGAFPVRYVDANVPQAWAVGAIVHLVTALAGLGADAPAGVLRIAPALPEWMPELTITNLHVGDAVVDLRLRRPSGVEVTRCVGTLRVESGR